MKKWNIIWWFKNDDEPKCPNDLWTGYPEWARTMLWYLRNPLHNFAFYVIGTCDKGYRFDVWGECKTNLILPFISYRGNTYECYIGWRPVKDRGQAFGLALRRAHG